MKKAIPLAISLLTIFSSGATLNSSKNLQKGNFLDNQAIMKKSFFDGNLYYSKYTNLLGNVVYYGPVTLKNTYYYPNETYIGTEGDTGVYVPTNIMNKLVFIIDGNVTDAKDFTITGKGYHTVTVSTYFVENNVKVVSKSYLESFTFYVDTTSLDVEVGKNKFYYEYYSSFDAMIDDIESRLFVTKDGSSYKVTLSNATIQALQYNYNEVIYNYNLDLVYQSTLTIEDKTVDLVCKSARASDESIESYRLLSTTNTDYVIDYQDIVGLDTSSNYKDVIKSVSQSGQKENYSLFNGLALEVTKGDEKEVYYGDEILEEGTPFTKALIKSNGSIDYDKIYNTYLSSDGTLDIKDGTWNDIKKTNDTFNLEIPDYLSRSIDITKNIYLVDYNAIRNDVRLNLKVNNNEKKEFYIYSDVTPTSSSIFESVPYVQISLPSASLLLNDYEGIKSVEVKKFLVDTTVSNTYTNTYLVNYKSSKLTSNEYTEDFEVIDDIPPTVITKYDVLWLDEAGKKTFLKNYTNYVRFVDNVAVDYSSLKISIPEDFYSNETTYFTVEIKDTSGNLFKGDYVVKEKVYDDRSDLEKGWDTFCYNWGHFFRELFGVNK